MQDVKYYEGRIVDLNRLPSSMNGNPRFLVDFLTLEGKFIQFRTAVDSQHGYEVENYFRNETTLHIGVGTHYRVKTVDTMEEFNP